ncbi:ETC complex I subunit conserved region-domain-containing protein [Annulohypoxylon maeteangense]|uniref:ETC complex I subunit conserved region-domain-containing protein n=1 Tax=Annulohypoxylon maeteangense TaxID=1927788 RepID=UPI0020076637|nr:ETC complex I subunit conserved region-domain-containing protein [Annulohypoxylon maeteangense]KAI0889552.1 ETC complex I subunit conserved region-domain-containing protein [Annulohypoxylon maeteangense]
MASLRSHAAAATLLRSARLVPSRQALAMVQRRFKSDDSTTSLTESGEPSVPEEKPRNAPDYGVHIDRATSTFTPIPKQVMDGSEDHDILPAAVLSGAPIELQARAVRIYRPSKPATQSGTWGAHHWRMDWDILSKGHRWENPLMGWQSSGDFMQGTKLEFKTKEDAIAFAEKQGYEYFVQEPNERAFTPKAYANNFLYTPKKLKLIRAK